jgi:short-subunit dehydrogenase
MSEPTVFITGASRGIGAAVAHQLAQRGARLALIGLEPARLEQLAASLGRPHAWFGCDVTDQAALDRAVDGAVRTFGGIDVVIANAGIASVGTVATASADELARVIDVNLTGVVRTVRSTLPYVIARRGYYLLVSSITAFAPMPGLAAYSATKSGVEQFAHALSYELAAKGVSVGVAYPCWTDTDLLRDAFAGLSMLREALNRLPGPFGTITSVEACARAIVKAVEHRQRRVYVPRSLAPFAVLRHLLARPPFDRLIQREAARTIPVLEQHVAALGPSFGGGTARTIPGGDPSAPNGA